MHKSKDHYFITNGMKQTTIGSKPGSSFHPIFLRN